MHQAPWSFVEKYYVDDNEEIESPESKWYLSWLHGVHGPNILNLGCGPQFYDDALHFGSLPERYVGIDINVNNLEFLKKSEHPALVHAREYVNAHVKNIELIEGDIGLLRPEFVGQFDSVLAVGVMQMFKDAKLETVLWNVHNYLKTTGRLVIVGWTEDILSQEKYSERRKYDWHTREEPTIKEIGDVLDKVGFDITKHAVYDVPNKKEYMWGKIFGYVAEKTA